MHTLTATETLAEARAARARGDVDATLRISALAMDKAKDERLPDVAFLAACAPGGLYINQGMRNEASGWYQHALQLALEYGLTGRLAEVYHDLFAVARDGGDEEQSRRLFSTALELHLDTRQSNPRISALFADKAEGLFMRDPTPEHAADASRQWKSACASLSGPAERFLAGCSILVCGAWLECPRQYSQGAEIIAENYSRLPNHYGTSLALSHAACGAIRARDYKRAACYACEALRVAAERGEGLCEERARYVLGEALAERESARLLA